MEIHLTNPAGIRTSIGSGKPVTACVKAARVGVDKQSHIDYKNGKAEGLKALLNKAKDGSYRAPSLKRVYIPKGNGEERRGVGIPTYEDKILQRAVVMLLEPIYEEEFHEVSFGFRPGKSPHQALWNTYASYSTQG